MNQVPVLLKANTELDSLVDQALVYLKAYKDTGDWGFIPTVKHSIERIIIIHMRKTNDTTSKAE